ncbi:MAG: hypothetical protein KF773_29665 [Deltaproteobacteria bacterium]|nr:hypothetical protein [Deltaproteobacteria bacterium]
MLRAFACSLLVAAGTGAAVAEPAPSAGDTLPLVPAAKLQWMYDVPSATDAAGKIVVHWYCSPRVSTCNDDLARIMTLKENHPRVYFVAYVNGAKADAQKLDPIRGSEGVGRGTVAYGPEAMAQFKRLGLVGPASFVVDVDGKVALASLGSGPSELDARDAKVAALANAIKEYAVTVEGPRTVKAGEKFTLGLKIQLATWLHYSKKPGAAFDFKLTIVPGDIKCEATALSTDQLKIADQTLSAQVTCSGPRGSYEMRGQINFSFDTAGGALGLGSDGATWKFQIE